MIDLLIVADDFTGALDTGVKFAKQGALVQVVTDYNYELKNCTDNIQVLVMDAETRHISGEQAYERIYKIFQQAKQNKVKYLFKKTDSALRGNIGSELEATIKATGEKRIHFIPALPQMNRITRNGVHYIDGVPVDKSVFGKDPFEPVTESDISKIIALQSNQTTIIRKKVENDKAEGVIIYDSESEEELIQIANSLKETDQLKLIAGCAGIADILPELLNLTGDKPDTPNLPDNFIVACGSVNPITVGQLDYAQEHGFERIRILPKQKLTEGYYDTEEGQQLINSIYERCKSNKQIIIDTNDEKGSHATKDYCNTNNISTEEMRVLISTSLGIIVNSLVNKGIESTMLITGGDSLLGFMKQAQVSIMKPICEVSMGSVLSEFSINGKKYYVISKSGGFGEQDLMCEIYKKTIKGGRQC